MRLHAFVDFVVGEIFAFVDEGLSVLVVGRIVEVLRLEGGGIDAGKTGIIALDDVLFCQLHNAPFHLLRYSSTVELTLSVLTCQRF